MIDPLQNVLQCADMLINYIRPRLGSADECTRWLAQIGEMDNVCEIHSQVKELRGAERGGEQG